jgi:hypothetical protein
MEAPTGTPRSRINPKSVNLGAGTPGVTAPVAAPSNSPFIGLDYRPNSGPNERNRGSPQGTALDLSALFSHPAVAAAAAAHPAVQAAAVQSNAPWGYGPYQKKVMGSGQPYGPNATDPAGFHSGYQ